MDLHASMKVVMILQEGHCTPMLTAVHATGAGVAQAKVAVPFQDSIRRGGSSTEASMSGYGMEGEP